jgi:NTE family protein
MKIGVALGGGAAKGLSHIGVLKALTEAGITVDVVSGTSVGALVGAAYAAGALDELEKLALTLKLRDIPLLMSPALSRQGLFSGRNALELLSTVIGAQTIEELDKRFAAVSVDLNKMELVTFQEGDLKTAIRASIAIPILFTPVLLEDRVLVDGGTLEPVPVEAAFALGADFVIAVDLFGNTTEFPTSESAAERRRAQRRIWPPAFDTARNYLSSLSEKFWLGETKSQTPSTPSIVDIIEGTTATVQRELTRHRFREFPPHITITPDVAHVGILDFHRGAAVIECGTRAVQHVLPHLRALLEKTTAST